MQLMAEMSEQVEIPNRALFKAVEVCDLAKVQPYVLRSWEAEFKDLGVTKSGSSTRVYRREDVERVLRIKHLVLHEGLTLAGVRRKLEEEAEEPLEAQLPLDPPARTFPDDARERIVAVRSGLRSLLDLLAAPLVATPSAESGTFELAPPVENEPGGKREPAKSVSPRRKRSA